MKTLKVQEALKELKGKWRWKKVLIYGEESYLTDQFLKKLEEKAIRLNPKGDVFRLYSKTH